MARVYKSPYPPLDPPRQTLFTYLLPTESTYAEEAPAFIDGITGEVLTRRALRTQAQTFAFGLRIGLERLGAINVANHHTILLFSPNSLSYVVAILAGLCGGLHISLASSAQTPTELVYQIKDSGPSHILVHPDLLPVCVEAFKLLGVSPEDMKHRVILLAPNATIPEAVLAEGWITMEATMYYNRPYAPDKRDDLDADETAVIFYSSGTTGLPKGVELSHHAIIAATQMMQSSGMYQLRYEEDVCLGVVPLYHVYGALMLIFYALDCGVPSIVLPKFEPLSFLKAIQNFKVTAGFIAPPVALFMANSPLVEQYDISSLKSFISSAAPLSIHLNERVTTRLRSRGAKSFRLAQGYGITEMSAGVSGLPDGRTDKVRSVGPIFANLEARLVVNEVDGIDAEQGQPGELWLRGPSQMKGYLGKPDATAASITSDGWYKTGDIAIFDEEGFMYIVDRKKELIKYKGYQVAPAEMESVLIGHPDILDAGVIAVPDPTDPENELPRAYIVPRDSKLTQNPAGDKFIADIHVYVKEKVSHYKQLRGGIILSTSIPRSPAGKILRKDLKALALGGVGAKAKL